MNRRALIWVVTSAALVAVVSAARASLSARDAAHRLAVLGFQSEGSSPRLIDRNDRAVTVVGIDGINLTGAGTVSAPDLAARGQLVRARRDGLPAVLLVGNWSDRVNDFYEPLAYRTLRSSSAVSAAASAIAHSVVTQGWNGVSVDLESLARRDRPGLTAFLAHLRRDLPAASSLTACLEAFTSTSRYAANGYDLAGIAANVDQIVLMTYDDHGPWENTPGPIGPLRWQKASIRALEKTVSARRILLGAANYGYAWRPHANLNLTVSQARALVVRWHAHGRWVPAVGEWTAKLRDGSALWWSDARSVRLRLELARKLGVDGVAVWSLGTGDPIPR